MADLPSRIGEVFAGSREWARYLILISSNRTLLNCNDLHPLGQWYRVTAVYDGKMLRNYVGDEMEGEGELHLTPQGAGHSSIGTRINLQYYFKGAVFEARFTQRALKPEEFLKMWEKQGHRD